MNILGDIFAAKREELAETMASESQVDLESRLGGLPAPISFSRSLLDPRKPIPRLIAEIKRKSPSRGTLYPSSDICKLARLYRQNGAAAISVLTDKTYFGGSIEDLARIATLDLSVPLLRKDFIFHPYQLIEARLAGASAVLLITAMLRSSDLKTLLSASAEHGLEALVEVYNETELDTALNAGAHIIGINNRNLIDFSVDLKTCIALRRRIPQNKISIAESGIHSLTDVRRLAGAGFDAILVGESLVTARDIGRKTREMAQYSRKIIVEEQS